MNLSSSNAADALRGALGPSSADLYARWMAAVARQAHPALVLALKRRYMARLAAESAAPPAAPPPVVQAPPAFEAPPVDDRPTPVAPNPLRAAFTLAAVTAPLWVTMLLTRK